MQEYNPKTYVHSLVKLRSSSNQHTSIEPYTDTSFVIKLTKHSLPKHAHHLKYIADPFTHTGNH